MSVLMRRIPALWSASVCPDKTPRATARRSSRRCRYRYGRICRADAQGAWPRHRLSCRDVIGLRVMMRRRSALAAILAQAHPALKKKGSGQPEPFSFDMLSRYAGLAGALDPARGLGPYGHEAFQPLQPLPRQFPMHLADLLRLGNEGLASLLGEFGLDLDGLVERPHARELFEKALGLFEGLHGVFTVGVRDCLKADPRI